MTYSQAIQLFLQENPGAGLSTPEEQDAFNQWAGARGGFTEDPTILDAYPDLLAQYQSAKAASPGIQPLDWIEQWANANPADPRLDDPQFLQTMDLEVEGTSMPYEQALFQGPVQGAIDRLLEGDAGRQAYVDQQLSTLAGTQANIDRVLTDLQANQIDGAAYLRANPDLVPDFQAQNAAGAPHARDINTYAQAHWEAYGKNEGRASPYISQTLLNEQAASRDAANTQLGLLNAQLDSLKRNLDTELGARATAIQTQVNSLYSNLDQLTSAQRQNLATQVASNYAALEQEVASRKASLADAINSMRGALTAEGTARRQALELELAKLNEAQGPLNEARLQSAQALATAVNLGLESTRDRIVADAARAGYVGGSTGTDMALTRATVGARQDAARAMADARTTNAADVAGIARYGATEGRRLTDTMAGAERELAFYGAGEGRSLADYGASGRRTIADFSAAGTRTIGDSAAGTRFDIGNFAAGQNRELADYGAGQRRAVGDFGAGETRNIGDAEAQRRLSYFNQDLARKLASLTLPAQSISAGLSTRQSLDNYANSGLRQSLDLLSNFNTNPNPAPNPGVVTTRPDVNGYENLGAGLLSLAGSVGNANRWWTSPTKQTTAPVSAAPDPSNPYDSL